ncbi:MFS transporter [Apilactobacillus ozensis]|uniref:MFS transporter n=1 Tax=Apilactobacillus ozensis TaxID=866801 RepID=UPI00200A958D|nr:MFS transporter [Apilactobacillus ozensis]MCK8607698.1 MFS transporter [Apilactobacillus ozensis]
MQENVNSFKLSNKQSSIQIYKDVLSNIISSFSGNMLSYGISLMILATTHSALSFGINMLINPISDILFVVPVSNIVDKFNHKKILIFCSIIRIFSLLTYLGIIYKMNNTSIICSTIIFLIIISVTDNTSSTAYSASVHELVNNESIKKLDSLSQAATAFSSVFSPVVGISLYSLIGINGFIIIEIISNTLSLIILFSMKFFIIKRKNTDNKIFSMSQFKNGLIYIYKHKSIKMIFSLSLIINLLFTALTIGIPFVMIHEINIGNIPVGILDTITAIGMLSGSLLASVLKLNKNINYLIILLLELIGFSIIGLGIILHFKSLTAVTLIGSTMMFFIGCFLAIINIIVQLHIQKNVSNEMLGRTFSTLNTLNNPTEPIGILLFSFLFQYIQNGSNIILSIGIIFSLYVFVMFKFINSAFITK